MDKKNGVRVLLTAFEPYEQWTENSSWLTLVELVHDRPRTPDLVTRRYPIDLAGVRERLYQDLQLGFDAIIHLGQSPGTAQIKLEAIALNVAGRVEQTGDELNMIEEHGPVAYRSSLPVGRWASLLRKHSIPSIVSYNAGTQLCNATMYSSIHLGRGMPQPPMVGFVHLPLAVQQVAASLQPLASMDVRMMASAIRLLLVDLVDHVPTSRQHRVMKPELA